jgi:hypothetical protein
LPKLFLESLYFRCLCRLNYIAVVFVVASVDVISLLRTSFVSFTGGSVWTSRASAHYLLGLSHRGQLKAILTDKHLVWGLLFRDALDHEGGLFIELGRLHLLLWLILLVADSVSRGVLLIFAVTIE